MVRIGSVDISKEAPKTIVPVPGATSEEVLAQVAQAVAGGADVLEWRVDMADCLGDVDACVERMAAVKAAAGDVGVLATVRTEAEGGAAQLSLADYEALVAALIASGNADAVDIEVSIDQACVERLIAAAREAGVTSVASYHGFDGMPEVIQIRGLLNQMRDEGADICKVAFASKSLADTQTLMAAISAFAATPENPPVIGIAMGEAGQLSRVACAAFGSALTFCGLPETLAVGQCSLQDTKQGSEAFVQAVSNHQFDAFAQAATPYVENTVTLLGSPVDHSLSPAIHNLSFALQGTNAFYGALDCSTEDVGVVIQAMKQTPGWVGSNVTMPCKQAVIEHLDELDQAAELMGAVNTIAIKDGKAIGYNTDGVGFVKNLEAHGVDVSQKRVYIMGAGGAASAVMVQCALAGALSVDVMCRKDSPHRESMEALAARVSQVSDCAMNVLVYADVEDLAMIVAGAEILVNATPVGMGEQADKLPVPTHQFHPGMVVADLVYFPQNTRLLQEAAAHGCAAVGGLGMLLYQAAEAERIWFEKDMDVNAVAAQLFG